MDLFGDLPEPTSSGSSVVNSAPESSSASRKRSLESVDGAVTNNTNKKLATGHVITKGYAAERKGEREEMQDAHVIIDDFLTHVSTAVSTYVSRLAYYAVFDGHGGKRASQYAADQLHKLMADRFPKGAENIEKDMKQCMVESFKKLDEDFLAEAKQKKPTWKDGATAVSLLLVNNTLFIGNLGDSKATLCRYDESSKQYTAVPLTTDHSPTLYEERMRIQKAGGYVREGRVMGILEVSRSIGDGSFKMHGISSTPDVKKCLLTSADRYIIVACDGLWKRFDNNSAIKFINRILEDESIEATETRSAEDIRFETACNRLANEAVRRLSADNVTVLLIKLRVS